MKIPKIRKENLGKIYLVGTILCIFGLLTGNIIVSIAGPVMLMWGFYSDDDPTNHIDPPDMPQMESLP
jgi:hypothetical protein